MSKKKRNQKKKKNKKTKKEEFETTFSDKQSYNVEWKNTTSLVMKLEDRPKEEPGKMKTKEKIDIGISLVNIVLTVFVLFFIQWKTLEIAKENKEIAKDNAEIVKKNNEITQQNRPLTYRTTVELADDKKISGSNISKFDYQMKFPLRIKNEIKSGEIKKVYIVTKDPKEPSDFRFIALDESKDFDFDLTATSSIESLKVFSIDFYVFYIDINEDIYFDFITLFPEYEDIISKIGIAESLTGREMQQDDNEHIVAKKMTVEKFNNYDFVTETIYNERIEEYREKYFVNDYKEVIQDSDDIIKILKKNLINIVE